MAGLEEEETLPLENPPLRTLGDLGVVMGELSQLWGSCLQPSRVPGHGRAGAGTGSCCYSSHAAGRISASAINHHVGRAWVSSNCFYLHNEARLSILLIFERGKSKSALDKQLPLLPPQSLPPTPNLCIFSLNAGFSGLWSPQEQRDHPRDPSHCCWVLGVLPLSPGRGRGAGGEGCGVEVSEWELGRGSGWDWGWKSGAPAGESGLSAGAGPARHRRGCGQRGLGGPRVGAQQMSLQPSATAVSPQPGPAGSWGPARAGMGLDLSSPVIPQGGRKGFVCTPGVAGWGDAPALGQGQSGKRPRRTWKKE